MTGDRAVFLDRDGTLMVDASYVGNVDRVILIPGAREALARLVDAGFRLFVITNQSGIARGCFSMDDVHEVHAHLGREFGRAGVSFERWLVCPHHPDDGCDCRKPKPRLVLEAARECGLDLGGSLMIGDRAADVELGHNAGMRSVLVLTGVGKEALEDSRVKPDHVAADIADAADWILASVD